MRKGSIKDSTKQVLQLHSDGKTVPEIESMTGLNRKNLYAMLSWYSIKPNKFIQKRKYSLDETYFESINSDRCAYFFGLLYADGWIGLNEEKRVCNISISLQEEDGYLLEELKKEIKYEGVVRTRVPQKEGWKTQKWLSIGSHKMVSDLIKNGCIQKKSLTKQFPSCILEKHLHAFIRGYFDGNGSVSITKKKDWRGKIIHIASSNAFIDHLGGILTKLSINCSIRRVGKISILDIRQKHSIEKFRDFIYQNDDISMTRKKEKMYATF